jgi:hypothetical protein
VFFELRDLSWRPVQVEAAAATMARSVGVLLIHGLAELLSAQVV